MVFESLVTDLINKFLGSYVERLDPSQLKLGLLGGDARLENLDIKANAFDEWDLPVKVCQGHIGRLTLKIPFKNLYTQPVIAELEDLYILVVPNLAVSYNEEKERKYAFEAKQRELQKIEEAKQKKEESKKKVSEQKTDSFAEKLAAQVVKNVQLSIRNIHIRYEDRFTVPDRPFTAGVTLYNLSFRTVDDKGNPVTIKDEMTREFFKSVELNNLTVYWNTKRAAKFYSDSSRGLIKSLLKTTICSPENPNVNHELVLKPFSARAFMHVHMRPETTNYTVPQADIQLSCSEIKLALDRTQYINITAFGEALDRAYTQSKYRKFRPTSAIAGNTRIWWKYPYNVVLEEVVRRRRKMWSWEHIRKHRQRCKSYVALWERKLLTSKLRPDELQELEKLEDELDVLNITLCRQRAEVQVQRKLAKKQEEKLAQEKAGGWFSGLFSRPKTNDPQVQQIEDHVRQEMTAEEKNSLYEAIGYSEQGGSEDIPVEYVSMKLRLNLHRFNVNLTDQALVDPLIMKMNIDKLSTIIEQRVAAKAIKIQALVHSMKINGVKKENHTVPTLVNSQLSDESVCLMDVLVETNPLNAKDNADTVVKVKTEPLQIVYDSDTVNQIVHFVTPPEDLRFKELSASFLASLEDVKAMTATSLKHMANKRFYTEISVDMKPSYFILPENGLYREGCRMLIVDLGSLKVESENTAPSLPEEFLSTDGKTLDYNKTKEHVYDKFIVTLSSMQMIMVEQGEDWRKIRTLSESPNHILRPLQFNFIFKKCIVTNDLKLPKMSLSGNLPLMSVNISDTLLKSTLELVLHVPFPSGPATSTASDDENEAFYEADDMEEFREYSSNRILQVLADDGDDGSSMSSFGVEDATSELGDSISIVTGEEDDEKFEDALDTFNERPIQRRRRKRANFTEIEMSFVIHRIELSVHERKKVTSEDNEILLLSMNGIGAEYVKKTYEQELQAFLCSIRVDVPMFQDKASGQCISIVETCEGSLNEKLLFMKLVIAEKNGPDFAAKDGHNMTRHKLNAEFKTLKVCLHQESLLKLIAFSSDLLPALTMADETPDLTVWSAHIGDKEELDKTRSHQEELNRMRTEQQKSAKGKVEQIYGNKRAVIEQRLEAFRANQKLGIKTLIPEIEITQWVVHAYMEKLEVVVCSLEEKLTVAHMQRLQADISMNYFETRVAATVADLEISDCDSNTVYPKILWVEPDENVLIFQAILFNERTSRPEKQFDLSAFDMIVNMEIGKAKIVFLYKFIARLLTFLEKFQYAIDQAAAQAQEISIAAVQKMQTEIETPSSDRISLNVLLKAPVIYVPRNTTSDQILILDLGHLSLKNAFETLPQESKAIVECTVIKLENLQVSRATMKEYNCQVLGHLTTPLNMGVSMRRNLSQSWFMEIPTISLDCTIKAIEASLTQGDYSVALSIVLQNLAESPQDTIPSNEPTVPSKKLTPQVSQQTRKAERSRSGTVASHQSTEGVASPNKTSTPVFTTVEIKFLMEKISLELFTGIDSFSEVRERCQVTDRALACCHLDGMTVVGKILSDNKCDFHMQMGSCVLTDTRPGGSPDRIRRIVDTKDEEKPFLLDMKFTQDENKKGTAFVEVCSIYVCVCMDYLLLLMDFFLKGLPSTEENTTGPPPPALPERTKTKKSKTNPTAKHQAPRENSLELKALIRRPEIILVENMDRKDTEAIILTTQMEFSCCMAQDRDIISGAVKEFQIFSCPFKEELRDKYKKQICSPASISLLLNAPMNDAMHGDVSMDELLFNVTPHVIQTLNNIFAALLTNNQDVAVTDEIVIPNVSPDFWSMKPFQMEEIPFLYEKMLQDELLASESLTIDSGVDVASMMPSEGDTTRVEKVMVRIEIIRLVLESETQKKCVPMFVVESTVAGEILNPTTNLCVNLNLEMAVSYYNDQISEWEPLLETYPLESDRRWCLKIQIDTMDNSLCEEDDGDTVDLGDDVVITPAVGIQRCIRITSDDNMELTLSKTAIDVLMNLSTAFQNAYKPTSIEYKQTISAPYTVENLTGEPITLYLDQRFLLSMSSDKRDLVTLANRDTLYLSDEQEMVSQAWGSLYARPPSKRKLRFRIGDSQIQEVNIRRSERHLYPLIRPATREPALAVVDITAYLGQMHITFRSPLQVWNKSNYVLDLYTPAAGSSSYEKVLQVDPQQTKCMPLQFCQKSALFLRDAADQWQLSKEAIKCSAFKKQILTCPTTDNRAMHFLVTPVPQETVESSLEVASFGSVFILEIMDPIRIHNQLPLPVQLLVQDKELQVESGGQMPLHDIYSDGSVVNLKFQYANAMWTGSLKVNSQSNQLEVISFSAQQDNKERQLHLRLHYKENLGQQNYTLFAPFWLLNKTELPLTFKTSDEQQFQHSGQLDVPDLFGFKSVKNSGNLSFKIADSEWSSKLPLEAVGSAGVLSCKRKNERAYEVRVMLELSTSCLTKIVTFMPFYMILNKTNMSLQCQEMHAEAVLLSVAPRQVVPFWPRQVDSKSLCIKARVDGGKKVNNSVDDFTQPFPIYETHSVFMKLKNQFGGLFVEVQTTDDLTLITFTQYEEGMVLAKLVNYLGDKSIFYRQSGTGVEHELRPGHSILYAWDDTRKKKQFEWRAGRDKRTTLVEHLTVDFMGKFSAEEEEACWVSFLSDTQRILLFTTDRKLATYAQLHEAREPFQQQVQLSLRSVGLSLVDSTVRQEVCYVSITSSRVQWYRLTRNGHPKALSSEQCQMLEREYTNYLNYLSIGQESPNVVRLFPKSGPPMEVDLSNLTMLSPKKFSLKRFFENAISVDFSFTSSTYNLHCKVFRLQVDSQITDAIFPVVFSPVPPPKSLDDPTPRPLVEFTVMMSLTKTPGVYRFRYTQMLIQEMQLKLDQGFITAMVNMFQSTVQTIPEHEAFQKDRQVIHNTLRDLPVVTSAIESGKKSIFDMMHISPIKMHMSFSLAGGGKGQDAYSEFMNLIMRSVGVVLTDVQDVVFKLAYFEKQNANLSMNQLQTLVQNHYINQAIRQMYVLVFGLDVLGNPFGVLRGVAQGVEDLFYEPVKGAVLGPEEFVQGVVTGVRSLFGHTVGGAAGAVSRITGTIGKGVAALTLDDEFQRYRREQKTRVPKTLGGRLVQGGEGLFMGIFNGVTGVVTQPISGARKDGVEGFFKGVGKGLIGVVARPVSGVVDFASTGFDGIRQAADLTEEVHRIRPPRFIAPDGVLRPYNLHEAEGNLVLMIMEKSKFKRNEKYLAHAVTKSKKQILLLTQRQLILADRNDFLGTWSCEWELPLESISGTPKIVNSVILSIPTNVMQKKFFGTSSTQVTKQVELDEMGAQFILSKLVKALPNRNAD